MVLKAKQVATKFIDIAYLRARAMELMNLL